VSSWRQQALIEAPVEEVWAMLVDPVRYSEWNSDVLEVTGAPTRIEQGSTFDLTSSGPLRLKATTTFKVERLDELKEIKMQCQLSGFYSHWLLTEARGSTFAEVELGVEPKPGLEARVAGALHTKRYLRRAVDQMLDELRRSAGRLTDRS
jgi:Polyketide cyclase / dehydrase and lipid transport